MGSHYKPQRTAVWLAAVMALGWVIGIGREFGVLPETPYRLSQGVCFCFTAYVILVMVATHESIRDFQRIVWLALAFGGVVLLLAAIAPIEPKSQVGFRLAKRLGTVSWFFAPFFTLLLYARSYEKMKSKLVGQVRERKRELVDANERLRNEMYEKLYVSNQLEIAKTDLDGTVEEKMGELEEVDRQLLRRERLEALSQVSAGISHELNNKLSPIVWYGAILSEDATLTGKQRERAQCMASAAQSAIGVVRNLQQFDHRGGIGAAFSIVSPKSVIRSVAESIRALITGVDDATTEQLRLEVRVDSKKMVLADPQQLRHLLSNLLSNAIDSLRKQENKYIRISSRDEAGWVVFEVSDNGRGMTEEESKRCFEPFFTTKSKKNGLGLSACYGIAKRHGGNLECLPNPNGGMTFRTYIPNVDEEVAPNDANGPPLESGTLSTSTNGPNTTPNATLAKVLFVEDNDTVRGAITDLLVLLGSEVIAVASGSEALQHLKDDRSIDLVITDLLMEGMSGIELLAACREIRDVPIVLISGWPRRRIVEQLEGMPQPDEILSKPCKVADLEQTLRRFASRGGDLAEPTPSEQGSHSV